jgi:hypothetical protein
MLRALLASPRRRRRFAWSLLPLLVLGGGLTAFAVFGGHGRNLEPDLTLTGEAQIYKPGREITLTRAQRSQADRTLHEFISAAVLREDPQAAWRLSSPELKAGVTRAQWDRGEMPVQPYPARIDKLSWRVLKAYRDHVELDVLLFPQPKANVGPMSFAVEMKPAREHGWAVSYWYPRRALVGGAPVAGKPGKSATPAPAPAKPARDTTKGRLGHWFFVIPLAILSLIVVVPLGVIFVTWYRGRRAYRRYARERS